MTAKSTAREWISVAAVCGLLLFCYHLLFSRFFPNASGALGHDYSYFLPQLLDGYFWHHKNGLFTPQWFTPAFCGGVPALPNPQNIFYSVPQWLTFIIDPLSAVYFSLLIFAAIGFVGFYLLLRFAFSTSMITALVGATLFFFNGFYAHRMLIGHLTFHAFMLLPLTAYLLLRPLPANGKPSRLRLATDASLAAVLLAYMVWSGMVHLLLPILLTLVAIGLVHGLLFGSAGLFWLRLMGAGVMSIALSACKLVASLAFLSHFERALYSLPGAGSIWGLLKMAFTSLFLAPSDDTGRNIIVNAQWELSRHEFEYGITLVPLLIVAIGAASALKNWRPLLARRALSAFQWVPLGLLFLLLLLPLIINYYSPGWSSVLKGIPVIRSSSNLLRWFCMYIPLVILAASLVLEKSDWLKQVRLYVGGWALITVLVFNVSVDREYYATQPYDPGPITKAYLQSHATDWSPVITHIHAFMDQSGRLLVPIYRNNTLAKSGSQLACYEPIFGYRLERFPLLSLHPGAITAERDGVLNIKNPACYVFGEVNGCAPGDHFSAAQAQEARAFVSYQTFEFKFPAWQRVANITSLCAIITVIGIWTLCIFRFLRESARRRH